MGETTVEGAAVAAAAVGKVKAKPSIVVPPRGSVESLFTNGLSGLGFSPGPMTLVSGFFAEQGGFSFSQLLAGAVASPIAAPKEEEDEKGNSAAGYKRNRPVNLAVAPSQQQLQVESLSPLFMVPPGFSPSGLLNSPRFLSPIQSPFGMSHQQALAHVTAQAAFSQMQGGHQHSATEAPPENPSSAPAPTESLPAGPESLKVEPSEVSQSDRKAAYGSGDKPASDGYNWRKYGQKQVKASEYPRSYYKCTHLNCPVKKKVERSADGHISEIVYKGLHNHDPPQNRRGKSDSSEAMRVDSDSESLNQNNNVASRHSNEREDNVIVIGDGDDNDEPVAKRRTMDAGHSMNPPPRQTITDSKIVVQTRSEVDLLDDGYKWRKYGQKVVKGNPHPRSYYKCTFAGCNVRKHVERSSADPKAVITTYEGKHNHEIPTGRYSSQQAKTNKNPLGSRSETHTGNKDHHQQMPLTLHLKEEQIAA